MEETAVNATVGGAHDERDEYDEHDELNAIRSRELDLKRNRGTIACAECRRLKLKCDRKLPCLSCKRRGCETICPTGVAARVRRPRRAPRPRNDAEDVSREPSVPISSSGSSKGSQEASRLRSKLRAISNHIRALEDALQAECTTRQILERLVGEREDDSHNAEERAADVRGSPGTRLGGGAAHSNRVSSGPIHPLLAPSLLSIKKSVESLATFLNKGTDADEPTASEDESTFGMIDAFGMLSIENGRRVHLLGASATEHNLLLAINDKEKLKREREFNQEMHDGSTFPLEIAQASASWPFPSTFLAAPSLATQLVMHLPPFQEALSLIDAYFSNFAWLYFPVDRKQVDEELLPMFYPPVAQNSSNPFSLAAQAVEHPRELALFFSLLACGILSNSTLGSESPEARRYANLARASFSLRSFLDEGSLSACQTLSLLSAAEGYMSRGPNERVTHYMSISLVLARKAGLNRDPEHLKLDSDTVQRRRQLFWELYHADLWMSITTGQPATFRRHVVDVQFPKFLDVFVGENGKEIISFQEWRYCYARDVIALMEEKISSARPVKYSEILQLDRSIQKFEAHPLATVGLPAGLDFAKLKYRQHPNASVWYRESSFLLIHRNFFARAMIDYPDDPLRSTFAPSIVAAYRCASRFIRMICGSYEVRKDMLARVWHIWAQCVSCSVILATIASKGRAISFSMEAFLELELSIKLYEKVTNPVIRHSLPSLKLLQNKASDVLFKDGRAVPALSKHLQASSSSRRGNLSTSSQEASSSRPSSSVVTADLFEKAMMAQFIKSKHEQHDASSEEPHIVPETSPSASRGHGDHSLPESSSCMWNGAPVAPDYHTYDGSVPSALDPSTMAQSTNVNVNLNAYTSVPELTYDADPKLNAEFYAMPDYDFNNIAQDVTMDAILNGDADWVNFMQLQGVAPPTAETIMTTDNRRETAVDWNSFRY